MGLSDKYRDSAERERAEVSEFLKSRGGQRMLIVVFGAIAVYAVGYLVVQIFQAVF